MPSKRPYRVSTHNLVNHPACKTLRDKLYGGVRGVVTTRRIVSPTNIAELAKEREDILLQLDDRVALPKRERKVLSAKLRKLERRLENPAVMQDLIQAFEQTRRYTQSRDYNEFYTRFDILRGLVPYGTEDIHSIAAMKLHAYQTMKGISKRYSYDPTLQNKLDEVESLYPCFKPHRNGK
ncbi:hypothetical protein KA107_03310 [Candidatus Pacearchaeota archaeon]|nr:hypothetical protein [Candidatus Pacearchaeota archaeon]